MTDGPPDLLVPDAKAWRAWLEAHRGDPIGVRLVLAKKGVEDPTSLTYAEALEEALCVGWIDGQVGKRDDRTFYQRFTPRRRRSIWSARNVGLIDRLSAEGRMHPSGVLAVEAAKADGRWEAAYAGPASADLPEDLRAALDANAAAKTMFDGLTSQNRFALIFRIGQLKTAAARTRRIETYVEMLARGETIHPQERKGGSPGPRSE